MKVIQVMPEFGLAGAEIMAENLIYGLKNLGIDVVVVSLFKYNSAITERLKRQGIRIYYLDKRLGLDIRMIYKLYKVFKKEQPDVLHTHRYVMQYAIPAAIMAGVLLKVHTVHSIATKENGNVQRKLNNIFYKFFNVIPVAITTAVQKTIADEYEITLNSIPVIHNGEDLSKYKSKTDYSLGSVIKLLHIGRFEEVKNHKGIVKAVSELVNEFPNIKLSLAGDGKLKPEVEKMVQKLGLTNRVFFCGLCPDVSDLLHGADIFVLPSIYEGMPMTLIEAMATGLPVVATKVGGIPDMIEDGKTGLLVDVDEYEIAEAIKRLIVDQALRGTLGKNALLKAQEYTAQNMASQYLKIYKN